MTQKIITINLSEVTVKALQLLQDMGAYPSRSEAIRTALRDFLLKEFKIELDSDESLISTQIEANEKKAATKEELKESIKKLKQRLKTEGV